MPVAAASSSTVYSSSLGSDARSTLTRSTFRSDRFAVTVSLSQSSPRRRDLHARPLHLRARGLPKDRADVLRAGGRPVPRPVGEGRDRPPRALAQGGRGRTAVL